MEYGIDGSFQTALWNFCRQFFYEFRSIDNTGHDRCDQCLFRDRGDLYFAAIGVLIWIAKHCGRYEHLKWCFKRREKRPGEPKTMFTPAFAVATVIVVIYMILRG